MYSQVILPSSLFTSRLGRPTESMLGLEEGVVMWRGLKIPSTLIAWGHELISMRHYGKPVQHSD